jgi:hypothetical protein
MTMRGAAAAWGVTLAVLPLSMWAQHGSVVAQRAPEQGPRAEQRVPETQFEVPEAERQAVVFLRYALDVKLQTAGAALGSRAIMTVRNDGSRPLAELPLQISSTLDWEAITAQGKPLGFARHRVDTDADHSGAMNEALVHLSAPLAPGAQTELTALYSGTVEPNARRLERIGTPPELAGQSDWDGIREDFTGLRGFGNVLWYPVCQRPVALGDGDRFFAEIGLARQRQSSATISITVTEESAGPPPTVAFLDGVPVPVEVTAQAEGGDLPSIATATLPPMQLGFATPSLFLARRTLEAGSRLKLYARESDIAATQAYVTAASILTAQMTQWLGAAKRDLNVLDLPASGDNPYEEHALFVTGMVAEVDPKKLLPALSHGLSHAYFYSPRPWLDEGVAQFMGLLWTEHQQGREAALTVLDNQRGALSLAETADPDRDLGEPLVRAHDPIFYRTKATYVLAMLRDIVGEKPLAAALQKYDAAHDSSDGYFEQLLEQASGQQLQWFFEDWVDHDRGLPELSIESVTPNPGSAGESYVVAVTIVNRGAAVVDVPVTVYSAAANVTERVRIGGRSSATHRFLVNGQPEQVQVNDGTVPEVDASVHRKDIRYKTP